MGVVAYLEPPGGQVDAHHLVTDADVDQRTVAMLLRTAHYQLLEAVDRAADDVGDPAGGVARPVALLEGDDLQGGVLAVGLCGRAHSRSIASHDRQPSSHLVRLAQCDRGRARGLSSLLEPHGRIWRSRAA